MSDDTNIIFIVGPTAVGKTEIAIEVASRIDAEIISADSMAVYRQMNIGIAKPTEEQRKNIYHHLVDVVDIWDAFTVAEYCRLAEIALEEIRSRGKVPLIVGGTGLYIKALTGGLFEGPAADWELRKKLKLQEHQNPGSLHEELKKIDPATAKKLSPNDLRRIVRAIEVFRLTQKPISSFQTQWGGGERQSLKLGLTMEREKLYRRIEQRCDKMIESGLIDETKRLMELGIEKNSAAMQAIGYKEFIEWLNGRTSREQAIADFKSASRRLAKRQLTWFRKDDTIHWNQLKEDSTSLDVADKLVMKINEHLGA